MSQQTNQSPDLQNFHWLDIVEIVSVIGSVGGSLLAIVLKQAALSSIPLSICVAVNLFNRNRLLKVQDDQTAIASITAQIEEDRTNIKNTIKQLTEVEQLIANLNKNNQELQETANNLEQKQRQIEKLMEELGKNQHVTQNIIVNNSSPESYYQLANHCENSGDKQKAIELYTEAIKHNRRDPRAYQQRGILRSELGDKQGAVQDLRMAAKFYFEQGDLENYQTAKDLSNQLYQMDDSSNTTNGKPIVLGNLFA